MRQLSLLFVVFVVMSVSGCHKHKPQYPDPPKRLPNPPILPSQALEKEGDPRLAELEDQMDVVYEEMDKLNLEARVTRRIRDKVEEGNDYLVRTRMSAGIEDAELIVFDLNQESKLINQYDKQTDRCLFETLTLSWIGESPPADRPYTSRIRDGTYLGLTKIGGKIYHQVQYPHAHGEVIETYYVNAETYLLAEWDSTHCQLDVNDDDPWMIVTRTYRYQELQPPLSEAPPTKLSAKQGDKR